MKKIFRRALLAKKVLFSKEEPQVVLISSQDQLRAQIQQSIFSVVGPSRSPDEEQVFFELVDEILSNIQLDGNEALKKNFSQIAHSIYGNNLWFFSLLVGVTAIWEFRVKLLASRLGVKVKKTKQEKNRKQKNIKVIVYKDMSEIIRGIHKNSNVSLNLKQDLELRNALAHGNFQQLRVLFNLPNTKVKDTNAGNVFVMKLSSLNPAESIINLSDTLSDENREEQDIFGWFLEGTNSKLLKEIFTYFNQKIEKINNLIEFNALSFGQAEGFFKRFVIDDEFFSDDHIRDFCEHVKSLESHKNMDAINFVEGIKESIKGPNE